MLRIISRKVSTFNIKLSSGKHKHDPRYKIYKLRCYSNRDLCPPPKKRAFPSTGTFYTLGAFALVGGVTIGYAKYDPDFREALVCKVPALDDFLKVCYGEEGFSEALRHSYISLKQAIYNLIFGSSEDQATVSREIAKSREYKVPTPIVPIVTNESKDEKYFEIRKEKKEAGQETELVEIGGVAKLQREDLPETHTTNVIQLEEELCLSSADAINAYNKAIYDIKRYNQEMECVIEESVDKMTTEAWQAVKRRSKEKEKSIKDAVIKSKVAVKQAAKLKQLVVQPSFDASETSRDILVTNIEKIESDIDRAKNELDRELRLGGVTFKYWDKVEVARKHFSEELESLFPTIDFKNKELKIQGEDLDLFLMHAYSHVMYYQKELARMETIAQERIEKAIEDAKKGGGEFLTDAQICEALEQEKRKIALCFQKQCLKLRKESECYLREQLKRQSQAFADHLEEAMRLKESEVDRGLARKFDEKLEEERCRFKMQLAAMIGRLRGLDRTMKIREVADEEARKSQVLWSACQALLRALRSTCPGLPWQTQLRSLTPEVEAVAKSAAEGDELVTAVLKAIPEEAISRGVFPEDALRERFLKVEKIARRVALVSGEGSALIVHILSYFQSLLLISAPSPIPQAELNNEETDFSKLTTNDILQRARYWLDRGNFMQTLKYLNLLKGASRNVARQWMNEARILLETQQAANTLMAHAASSGLMYL